MFSTDSDPPLNEHNNLVEEYNTVLARRGERYREYESALDAANLRIQLHNARR